MAYSTNLSIHGKTNLFDGDDVCIGSAYGWEIVERDEEGSVTHVGPATQTAKDNALLWSKAPEMLDLLKEYVQADPVHDEFWDKATALLTQLHFDCGPLCPEHGDVRDTSVMKE